MKKIFIISTTYIATGGTELLQQLCYKLNSMGQDARMMYTQPYDNSNVQKRFETIYNNPYCYEFEDEDDNIIVVPESIIEYVYKVKKAKMYLWWLSVDNYYGAFTKKENCLKHCYHQINHLRNKSVFKNIKHLVQSEYARLYLLNECNVSGDCIFYLSDYLNKSYLQKATSTTSKVRKDQIIYNPRKGFEFSQKIMQLVTEYEWVPLQGYTPDQMVSVMNESKVYVDFGNHPGKDRIPREAAMCGCCVITGKRGAAANSKDILIPDDYKFSDDDNNIDLIKKCISTCMEFFDDKTKDFDMYRNRIMSEEEQFESDIKQIFIE